MVSCRLFDIKLKLATLPAGVLVCNLLHSFFLVTSLLRSFFSEKYLCPTTTLQNKIMLIKSYCRQIISDFLSTAETDNCTFNYYRSDAKAAL